MRIHREGLKVIAWNIMFSVVFLFAIHLLLPGYKTLHYITYLFLLVGNIWSVSFFRVPARTVRSDDNLIYSAADGRVVAIEEVFEDEYFHDKRLQISVFMSPLNVHVNWYPVNGKIVYTKYHPGKFLVAWLPKSSILNERTSIVLERDDGKALMIRQIAGFVARRIVYTSKPGDQTRQGDEFGIIRFGSRVDFFLPTDSIVKVNIGDKVRGQQTVIATFHK